MTIKTPNANRQQGFTLIELVIVIAVLGALAAIAVPQLTGVQADAEAKGAARAAASEASTAFASAYADGVTDGSGAANDPTGINWEAESVCGELPSDGNGITPSLEGYAISKGTGGDAEFSVPSYNATDDAIEEQTCNLSSS